MKKILLALLAVSSVSAFAVSSVGSTLSVTGTLVGACTSTFGGGGGNGTASFNNINPLATINQEAPATLTLQCTAGTQISSITAYSTGGFNLKLGTDVIPYVLSASVGGSIYSGGIVNPTWSSPGSVAIITETPGAFDISDGGDPVNITLTAVIAPNTVPALANSGDYTDSVTITTYY